MTAEEWRRVREIFEAALERDASARAQYVEQACAGDSPLRAEVTSLLEAHVTADDFIEIPAYHAAADLLVDPPVDPLVGRSLGPYLIRQEIGRGGMGVVYLADDTRLSRRVALKAVTVDAESSARTRARIAQEARAAAALSHPGIATVYALEEIDGALYIACEYVPGPTLRTLLGRGPLALPEILDIARQLANALAAAHGQGVVHGDLKPENVVRTSTGMVKVLDFGVARFETVAPDAAGASGGLTGTPAYMAPEQIRGEAVDFRSDLFSLGVVLYELATGVNPFEAPSTRATLVRIVEFTPAPLSSVSPGFHVLDAIVGRCLAKSPHDRYPSPQRLADDLERLHAEMSASFDQQPLRSAPSTLGPRWWWAFHQGAVSVVYLLMLYPAWRARRWLPQPWELLFLLSLLASAAAAITLRLHLWFTARFIPRELPAQLVGSVHWTRWSDTGFSCALLGAAVGIGGEHPEMALLFVAVATAATVASFMIEPATTRAAFKR